MNKYFGFLAGAMLGALVGSTLALLLAPASGEELRGQIRERKDYISSEVQRAANERRAELEQQLAELRAPRRPAPSTPAKTQ
jgi:gas vesicle protein